MKWGGPGLLTSGTTKSPFVGNPDHCPSQGAACAAAPSDLYCDCRGPVVNLPRLQVIEVAPRPKGCRRLQFGPAAQYEHGARHQPAGGDNGGPPLLDGVNSLRTHRPGGVEVHTYPMKYEQAH